MNCKKNCWTEDNPDHLLQPLLIGFASQFPSFQTSFKYQSDEIRTTYFFFQHIQQHLKNYEI